MWARGGLFVGRMGHVGLPIGSCGQKGFSGLGRLCWAEWRAGSGDWPSWWADHGNRDCQPAALYEGWLHSATPARYGSRENLGCGHGDKRRSSTAGLHLLATCECFKALGGHCSGEFQVAAAVVVEGIRRRSLTLITVISFSWYPVCQHQAPHRCVLAQQTSLHHSST